MTRVLIVFGTTDGHTQKIAAELAGALSRAGILVDVFEAGEVPPALALGDYDGVMVAASVHIGTYQRAVRRWVRRHADALNRMATAFISVCLAVLEQDPESHRAVEEIARRFFRRSGWQPTMSRTVAGAVPYTRYGWLKRWAMKRKVGRAGGATDTTRDYEYTDWNDLRRFAGEFARRLSVGQVMGGGR